VRRPAPRSLSAALPGALAGAAPPTLLARVQAAWPAVAGERVAAAASPVGERDGVVTVACESSLWAHELDLLQGDLLARLRAAGGEGVERIRFRAGSGPNRP
jgi:predicted nucleic acid-binding Zn ribbon protein